MRKWVLYLIWLAMIIALNSQSAVKVLADVGGWGRAMIG